MECLHAHDSSAKYLLGFLQYFSVGKNNVRKARDPRSNLITSEDSQLMVSYRLVSYCKLLGQIISELKALLSLPVFV